MLFAIITTIASTPLRREGRYFKNEKMDIVFLFFYKDGSFFGFSHLSYHHFSFCFKKTFDFFPKWRYFAKR